MDLFIYLFSKDTVLVLWFLGEEDTVLVLHVHVMHGQTWTKHMVAIPQDWSD